MIKTLRYGQTFRLAIQIPARNYKVVGLMLHDNGNMYVIATLGSNLRYPITFGIMEHWNPELAL